MVFRTTVFPSIMSILQSSFAHQLMPKTIIIVYNNIPQYQYTGIIYMTLLCCFISFYGSDELYIIIPAHLMFIDVLCLDVVSTSMIHSAIHQQESEIQFRLERKRSLEESKS